jgi:hypothetical protein
VIPADRQSNEPEVRGHGALEIEKNPGLQTRFWRLQRAGWVIVAVLIVAAAMGLFSGGPLSWAVATDPGNALRVDYERFMRQDALHHIRLAIEPAGGRTVDLQIGQPFLDAVRIEEFAPLPRAQFLERDGQVVRFRAAGDGLASFIVNLTVEPKRVGIVSSTIAIAGEAPVRFTQFVFP